MFQLPCVAVVFSRRLWGPYFLPVTGLALLVRAKVHKKGSFPPGRETGFFGARSNYRDFEHLEPCPSGRGRSFRVSSLGGAWLFVQGELQVSEVDTVHASGRLPGT